MRRILSPLLLLLAPLLQGCADGAGPERGLIPGKYRVTFELVSSLTTPDPLEGRHEITFRMRAPGVSASDVELVSSRRILEGGSVVSDYLVVEPSVLDIREGRWELRFPYAAGGFSVSWNLVELSSGAVAIAPGCYATPDGGGSYQGAGCRLERL